MARQLIIELVGDHAKLQKSLHAAESRTKRFSQKMSSAGTTLSKRLTLPIVGAGVAAFKMASDMNEAISAADVRFGRNADKVQKWSKELDTAFGLTRREALEMVTQLRAVTQNSELTDDQMLKLAERAADVGSQFNASSTEVGERFRSALTGSSEVLERFGVDIKQGSAGMTAYAESIGKSVTELTQAEKQQAIYNIIMEETAITQGDAANTADTAAGKMRILKADVGRAAEEIGQKLLPAGEKLLGWLTSVIGGLDSIPGGSTNAIAALAAMAALGPVMKGVAASITAVQFAVRGVTTAMDALRVAVSQHPFFVVASVMVTAAEASERLIGGFDGIRNSLFNLSDQVRQVRDRFRDLFTWVTKVANKIGSIPGSVLGAGGGLIGSIGGLLGFQTGGVVPGTPGMPVPIIAHAGERVSRMADSGRGGGGGNTFNINLHGVGMGRDFGQAVADALRDNDLIGVS